MVVALLQWHQAGRRGNPVSKGLIVLDYSGESYRARLVSNTLTVI